MRCLNKEPCLDWDETLCRDREYVEACVGNGGYIGGVNEVSEQIDKDYEALTAERDELKAENVALYKREVDLMDIEHDLLAQLETNARSYGENVFEFEQRIAALDKVVEAGGWYVDVVRTLKDCIYRFNIKLDTRGELHKTFKQAEKAIKQAIEEAKG